MSIEVMKQALEALESAVEQLAKPYSTQAQYAITSLRQAIARAEHLEAEKQEPVAMQMDVIVVNLVREGINKHRARELAEHFIKHTTPQQRTWVGLTDEDRQAAFESLPDMLDGFLHKWGWLHFSKAIEAKLKEKNT